MLRAVLPYGVLVSVFSTAISFLFHRLCCVLYSFVSFYIFRSVVFTSYLFKNAHGHYAFFLFVVVVSHVCKRREPYVVDVSMFLWACGLLLRPAEEYSVLKLFEVASFNALWILLTIKFQNTFKLESIAMIIRFTDKKITKKRSLKTRTVSFLTCLHERFAVTC